MGFFLLLLFLTIELGKLFIYSKNKPFVIYEVCIYFFYVYSLSFYPFHRDFHKTKVFTFDEIYQLFLFWIVWVSFLPSSRSPYFYIFFSKRFIDLYFTFKSTIHFELLFVSGLRLKWRFLFLPIAPSSFVEKTILLHCICLHHCLKSVGHTYVGQSVGSLFWSTDTFIYPFPVTTQP